MQNPLSDKQRIRLMRGIVTHDAMDILSQAFATVFTSLRNPEVAFDPHTERKAQAYFAHRKHIYRAIDCLGDDEVRLEVVNLDEMGMAFSNLEVVLGKQVKSAISFERRFEGNLSLRYLALFNLAKNSLEATKGKGEVLVDVAEFSGEISNPINTSYSQNTGDFIRFSVRDDGPGFSTSDHGSFFEDRCSTKKDGGFGLHLVKCICAYLGDYICVASSPGKTSVDLYHPV
jgi:signal transduction histidine kinase